MPTAASKPMKMNAIRMMAWPVSRERVERWGSIVCADSNLIDRSGGGVGHDRVHRNPDIAWNEDREERQRQHLSMAIEDFDEEEALLGRCRIDQAADP